MPAALYEIESRTRTDWGEEVVLNMGPQHPSTHGVLRLEICLDGEMIRWVRPHIGYLHRCFEKHAEALTYPQVIPYTDRMDYVAAMNNELGYCLAVERLMGTPPLPERVEWLRILVAELNRIASHLLAVGTFGLDVGTITPFMHCFADRELILSLFEWTSGARLLYNYVWIGGVAFDVPEGFEAKCREFLDLLESHLPDLDRLMTTNRIFIHRTASTGIISIEQAVEYGITGPNLRGSGAKRDLRKDEPYSLYPKLEFDVPVGLGCFGPLGSTWDRYWVRMQEMRESARIVRQVLQRLEKTPRIDVRQAVPKRVRPPAGEVYGRTETPRGELGYYVVSDNTDKPWRVKVRSPCFCTIAAADELSRGALIADAVATIGSLDIVLGEIDR